MGSSLAIQLSASSAHQYRLCIVSVEDSAVASRRSAAGLQGMRDPQQTIVRRRDPMRASTSGLPIYGSLSILPQDCHQLILAGFAITWKNPAAEMTNDINTTQPNHAKDQTARQPKFIKNQQPNTEHAKAMQLIHLTRFHMSFSCSLFACVFLMCFFLFVFLVCACVCVCVCACVWLCMCAVWFCFLLCFPELFTLFCLFASFSAIDMQIFPLAVPGTGYYKGHERLFSTRNMIEFCQFWGPGGFWW